MGIIMKNDSKLSRRKLLVSVPAVGAVMVPVAATALSAVTCRRRRRLQRNLGMARSGIAHSA